MRPLPRATLARRAPCNDTTIRMTTDSQRKAARVAGLAYLFTFAAIVFAQFRIHDHLIVDSSPVETALNIQTHERLFRIGIACGLFYSAGLVVLLTSLYVVLEPINRAIALLCALLRLVYALVWVRMTLNLLDALRLLRDADYLRLLGPEHVHALAMLSLGERFDEYYVALLFGALASTGTSYLWFHSRYIPRALAAFGVLSSLSCAACTLAFIVFPGFKSAVNLWLFDTPMGLFDLGTSFWLLVKGLRPPRVGPVDLT